ncbi:hypothetical protein DICPUDRAFT_51938 [Dictyostelium purpureum]|uniref:Ankyrin repeat domain-containing protein n=1 Tax=Dictyostelium purpureum TaxID=5786 RepID=F1A690_DICPU|nr:uncharacterized protein DICPUDRAFT_51938 [Dictyostelium purpureum]EGC28290.1 hypothetical protein DICPUDRAFT_51938 [Dictyostelium purpureum]|eukprot:XP_003295183.1 hypothetical protein DICPUDRAFT_51938 [Dictyostelium purpureum]
MDFLKNKYNELTNNSTSSNVTADKYKDIKEPFLLHKLACEGKYDEIKQSIETIPYYKEFIDIRDTHGYPASHYAAHLGYGNIVELLLKSGADPDRKSAAGWSLLQEAIGRKDREIVTMVLLELKLKIEREFNKRVPTLVQALENIPDFEMELKWEVKSWVPLVTRFCPYDTYKIYKQGASLRADTTIIGMDGIKFIRGDLTFLYKNLRLFSLDNIKKQYSEMELVASKNPVVHEEEVDICLDQHIRRVKLMTDAIQFQPAKTWLGYEKTEAIGDKGDWSAKIFDVSNVDLKTCTRKSKRQPNHPSLNDMQNTTTGSKKDKKKQIKGDEIDEDEEEDQVITTNKDHLDESGKDHNVNSPVAQTKKYLDSLKHRTYTIRESTVKSKIFSDPHYFDAPKDFDPYTFEQNFDKTKVKSQGLLCEGETISERHRYFKGTIWISEDFPRKVADLLPIFEVLAPTNKLFSRLSEFIQLKLPSQGFPVKLDIPLVPTISATVIFTKYQEKEVDKNLFCVPTDYVEHKKQPKN